MIIVFHDCLVFGRFDDFDDAIDEAIEEDIGDLCDGGWTLGDDPSGSSGIHFTVVRFSPSVNRLSSSLLSFLMLCSLSPATNT